MKKQEALCPTTLVCDRRSRQNSWVAWPLKSRKVLRGKHKPIFTPNQDAGDFVIVINARGVKLTGD